MGVVKCFKYLVNVQSDVHVIEAPDQLLGLDVRDILKHETGSLRTLLTNHIIHTHNVRSSIQVLQDLRFAVDFFRSNRLQNLDHAFFIILDARSLINFRIFAASKLLHDLVLGKIAPLDIVLGIVRVVLGSFCADLFVGAFEARAVDYWWDLRTCRVTSTCRQLLNVLAEPLLLLHIVFFHI